MEKNDERAVEQEDGVERDDVGGVEGRNVGENQGNEGPVINQVNEDGVSVMQSRNNAQSDDEERSHGDVMVTDDKAVKARNVDDVIPKDINQPQEMTGGTEKRSTIDKRPINVSKNNYQSQYQRGAIDAMMSNAKKKLDSNNALNNADAIIRDESGGIFSDSINSRSDLNALNVTPSSQINKRKAKTSPDKDADNSYDKKKLNVDGASVVNSEEMSDRSKLPPNVPVALNSPQKKTQQQTIHQTYNSSKKSNNSSIVKKNDDKKNKAKANEVVGKCHICNRDLVRRQSKTDANNGRWFWNCVGSHKNVLDKCNNNFMWESDAISRHGCDTIAQYRSLMKKRRNNQNHASDFNREKEKNHSKDDYED